MNKITLLLSIWTLLISSISFAGRGPAMEPISLVSLNLVVNTYNQLHSDVRQLMAVVQKNRTNEDKKFIQNLLRKEGNLKLPKATIDGRSIVLQLDKTTYRFSIVDLTRSIYSINDQTFKFSNKTSIDQLYNKIYTALQQNNKSLGLKAIDFVISPSYAIAPLLILGAFAIAGTALTILTDTLAEGTLLRDLADANGKCNSNLFSLKYKIEQYSESEVKGQVDQSILDQLNKQSKQLFDFKLQKKMVEGIDCMGIDSCEDQKAGLNDCLNETKQLHGKIANMIKDRSNQEERQQEAQKIVKEKTPQQNEAMEKSPASSSNQQ